MNYGHPLKFGTFITPLSKAPEQIVALAKRSEELGYDVGPFKIIPDNFNILPQAATD